MSIISISRRFYHRFPGPFAYQHGRFRVDNTFDVYCRTTGEHLLSTYYWDEREHSQLQARIACLALSAPAFEYRIKGVEHHLQAFCELFPGPYRSRRDFCEYYGPMFEVYSKVSNDPVFMLLDYIRKNGLISRHLAHALNALLKPYLRSDEQLPASTHTLTA